MKNIFKDKKLLIAGGLDGIAQVLMRHALEHGVKEIRMLDGDEMRLVEAREELLAERPCTADTVKFYYVDLCDSESVDDSVREVDIVLCIPTKKTVTDIESSPAYACTSLINSTVNVMQAAVKYGVGKVVVLTPSYKKPLYNTPDLLAALIEKVVVAQCRYQMKDTKTLICCARMDSDVIGLVNYSLAGAKNGDLVLKQDGGYYSYPCYNPDFERDDLTNI